MVNLQGAQWTEGLDKSEKVPTKTSREASFLESLC